MLHSDKLRLGTITYISREKYWKEQLLIDSIKLDSSMNRDKTKMFPLYKRNWSEFNRVGNTIRTLVAKEMYYGLIFPRVKQW